VVAAFDAGAITSDAGALLLSATDRASGRHLLAAKLRRANIDAAAGSVAARIVAQIRRRWPLVRILLRADSGFAREELMAWCEANGVHFLFGLAKTDRLIAEINAELEGAAAQSRRTGKPARRLKDFRWLGASDFGQRHVRRILSDRAPLGRLTALHVLPEGELPMASVSAVSSASAVQRPACLPL
jgi:Transposase DDE domain group 1